jgi:hypothetical protein
MQINGTKKYHLALVKMVIKRQEISDGESKEERKLTNNVSESRNWHSHYGKQSEDYSIN